MKRGSRAAVTATALLAAVGLACATTTTWTDQPSLGGAPRTGRIESVQEVVHHVEGNPAGGALLGGLLGGILFGGRGPSRLFGAAAGAAVGAAASQGSYEHRDYQVLVRFDDGTFGMFTYANYAPFAPGEAVVLTPQGLARM